LLTAAERLMAVTGTAIELCPVAFDASQKHENTTTMRAIVKT
jgi:hypothetical protein